MKKTKNEIMKGLHFSIDAINKSQSETKEIYFIKRQIENTIEYLEGGCGCKNGG